MSQQINLYQDPSRGQRDLTDAGHLALALGLVVVVLALVSGGLAWRAHSAERTAAELADRRDSLQAELEPLRERVQAATGDDQPDQAIENLRRELAAKQRLIEHIDARTGRDRPPFSAYLEGLARSHVAELWLDRVELKAGGGSLRLAGHARDPERVPTLLDRLAERAAYSGHNFRTLRMTRAEDDSGQLDFTLASGRTGGEG